MFIDLKTDILDAAEKGDIEGIKRTLKKSIDLNIFLPIINAQDEKGRSALHLAINTRTVGVATLLLDSGSEVNTSTNEKDDYEGETPLISASARGFNELVNKLLQKGAIVNAMKKNKEDAASFAASNGHLETLKLLIRKDPSVADRQGFYGTTPLSWAARNGQLEMVKYLIENYNPRINIQDDNNETPLILAAYENHPKVVEYLLNKGAYASIKGYRGKTALEWAMEENNKEVIKIIKEHIEK